MSYHTYADIAARFHVSTREARRLVVPAVGHLVRSSDVCAALNAHRSNGQPPVQDDRAALMPRILTAEEVAEATGIPVEYVKRFTRRAVRPMPAWRFSKRIIRYHLPSVTRWIEAPANSRRKLHK